MASEWVTLRLGDVCTKIGSGATPRGGSEAYLPSGMYSLIRSQNIYNEGFRAQGLAYISKEQAEQLANVVVEEGDVLLNITGDSVARCCQVDPSVLPARVNQHVAIVRPKEGLLNSTFLRYALISPSLQSQMLAWAAAGATRNALTKSMIEAFTLRAPSSIRHQALIASFLKILDDKIQLNRKMSETLEGMARALFKSWFVDFDPVRAKAESRDTGLPPHIADLFPARLESSSIGEVPVGWGVVPLTALIDVNPHRRLSKGAIAPYLDMANMPSEGHSASKIVPREYGSGMRFKNGDTLVARITPCLENGKTAFVDFLDDGEIGWGSTEFLVLRPRDALPEEFAYCLARSNELRDFAIQSMTGSSGRQRVAADSLAHFVVARPSKAVAQQFGRIVKHLFQRARDAGRENQTLSLLRDTLLPKLISGEIRLRPMLEL